MEFKDLGADYYTQFNREKKINSHLKQLSKLGVNFPDKILADAIERPPDWCLNTTTFQVSKFEDA